MFDGDGIYEVIDVIKMFDLFIEGYDYVIGDWFVDMWLGVMMWFNRVGNCIINWVFVFIYG